MFSMNRIQKIALIIFVLATALTTGTAQENRHILIEYVANEELPVESVQEILSNLETRLQEHNITATIEPFTDRWSIMPETDNVHIVMRQVFVNGQVTAIQMTAYVNNIDITSTSSVLNPITPLFENVPLTRLHWVDRTVAHILYSFGEYEEIKEQLADNINNTEVCRIMPHRILGNIAMLEADYEAAISYFLCTLEDYEFPTPHNLIWSYARSGDLETALDYLEEEFRRNRDIEDELQLLELRARVYATAFDYDSAITGMDETIARAEENELDNRTLAELYTDRGEIIFLIYEWDRVEDNFDTAIELDPDYAPAYFQRGVLFYTMARRDDALADFETYLELNVDGLHAEEAESYIESIQIELDALDG